MSIFKLILAVCFAALGALFVASYLRGLEPRHPHAGQVVEPNWRGWHDQKNSDVPIVYSLYEYYEPTHFHITGKSIRFAIPDSLTQANMMSGNGGPAYTIRINYNPDNDKSCWRTDGDREAYERCSANKIHLDVKFSGDIGPWSEQEILSGKVTEALMNGFGSRPRLKKLNDPYCGFTIFDRAEPSKPVRVDESARHVTPADPRWPFADSVVLAKPHADGSMFPLVTCSKDIKRDGFAYCAMPGSYRGWPTLFLFSGRHVCEAEAMITHANKLLDRFRISETERSPGQSEHRHFKRRL